MCCVLCCFVLLFSLKRNRSCAGEGPTATRVTRVMMMTTTSIKMTMMVTIMAPLNDDGRDDDVFFAVCVSTLNR